MITIAILIAAVAVVLAGVLAAASRVEVATSSGSALGSLFANAPMPARPRGLQEEDLPRFVFQGEASSAL